MSQIIASTYEVLQEIGSGGGGVVYLGRHLRLGKLVVLKADKRKLTTKPEVLRREVDALKNLSHTYIPQVYDFVAEGETVYTVMDYIEGESLDKPLKRGERFSQPQVIQWACQLLEALCYLHSRPPHGILHSDIKPANVMLTPQDGIRLIDFNIALALGEGGAVRVGFSRGYASPEHYGIDYSDAALTQHGTGATTQVSTDPGRTVVGNSFHSGSGSDRSSKRSVLLDVRSDIYSLGATLYHLLTGTRPAQDAKMVVPITDPAVSPAVAQIIAKAMSPDPALRYQTAEEMLYAFEHLHEHDPRTKRHKRCWITIAAVLATVFLTGGISTFSGLRQMEQAQEAARIAAEQAEASEREAKEAEREAKEAEQRAKDALAAIRTAEQAVRDGDVQLAAQQAVTALELETIYQTQAQTVLTDALGVYALSSGYRSHLRIELPSAPLKVALSPNGTKIAVMTSGELHVFDTESGEKITVLGAAPSALSDVVFLDENQIVYAGPDALTAYRISDSTQLWSGKPATGIVLSADRSTMAAVYKDENLAAIYNASTGEAIRTVTFQEKRQDVVTNDIFADPQDDIFALNRNGTKLAVSFYNGALRVYDLQDSHGDLEIYDKSEFMRFEGGFHGDYLAYSATGAERSVFAVIDTAAAVQTGGFESTMPFHVQADETGVYLSSENVLVQLDPETGEQTEVAYTETDITLFQKTDPYSIVATVDGTFCVFGAQAQLLDTYSESDRCDLVSMAGDYAVVGCLDVPYLRILKTVDTADTQVFSYDGAYLHNEARLSADGSTVMLFRYDGFRLYSIEGALLAEVSLPDAEQIYDQQYRRDEKGSRLDVIYYSGLVRSYSAEDGQLLQEIQGEPPRDDLYEEFLTDRLKITSPLHGTPVAYDRETGTQIRELESDAYLTYVTQVEDYVITEYITAEGERYALLLNADCETLARMSGLCDITADGILIFDDMTGTLRQSRIYSIEELQALANH